MTMGEQPAEDEDISGVDRADIGDLANGGNLNYESRPRHVNIKAFSGDRKPGVYREWKKDVM
eukprot:5167564-Heterocapsa_arctica.AAC.1